MRKVLCGLAALALAGGSASAATILTDGGFDGGTYAETYTWNNTQLNGWYATTIGTPGWQIQTSTGNPYLEKVTEGGWQDVIQVVNDANRTTGPQTLSFDYRGGSGAASNKVWIDVRGLGTLPSSFALDQSIANFGGTRLFSDQSATTNANFTVVAGQFSPNDNLTSDWMHVTLTVDMGATGYNYIMVGFRGQRGTGSVNPSIDNVELTGVAAAVPEPASLGLLGLGSLLALRRRRA